ncbi:MAG: hypothetical protein HY064_15715 [Bacteroidetes bacterium]|nr:hypothetical protein [Bacteroidota bacterium]
MKIPPKYFLILPAIIFFTFLFVNVCESFPPSKENFRQQQKQFPKVKTAYDLKWDALKAKLNSLGVDSNSFKVFIRGFKKEGELEVWVKSAKNNSWIKFETYSICQSSGTAGPKRCQGDGQVPEGFYHVSVFNPYSNYLISLGVSYPNKSDRMLGCSGDKGGAIMIHGNCVTIGCIPITDDKIREVYVLCVEAKNDGQTEISIHLFPARMTQENLSSLEKEFPDKATHDFWENIKTGYEFFENSKTLPAVSIDAKGKYIFK